jgi:hypothetical protein
MKNISLWVCSWWPQIAHNARQGYRPSQMALSPRYVVGVTAARLLLPFYLYMCPDNYVHFRPSVGFCATLMCWVLPQVGVLLVQQRHGTEAVLPECLLLRLPTPQGPVRCEVSIHPSSEEPAQSLRAPILTTPQV